MKTLSFYPGSKEVELIVKPPQPAKQYIQNWYKNIKHFKEDDITIENGKVTNFSVKACVPFHDVMTMGYIQETWCDIYINKTNDNYIEYQYSGLPSIVYHRKEPNVPVEEHFYGMEFVWKMPWMPKTPAGYSILLTTPQNFILPFKTLSGIIDSDNFYHSLNGEIPFYIYKNFSGIIPAGTPMYQITMIKRDNWNRRIEKWNEEDAIKRFGYRMSKFIGMYKNNFHIKKKYL